MYFEQPSFTALVKATEAHGEKGLKVDHIVVLIIQQFYFNVRIIKQKTFDVFCCQ